MKPTHILFNSWTDPPCLAATFLTGRRRGDIPWTTVFWAAVSGARNICRELCSKRVGRWEYNCELFVCVFILLMDMTLKSQYWHWSSLWMVSKKKMLDPLNFFFGFDRQKKERKKEEEKNCPPQPSKKIWYRCYYLHRLRNSVSPVCGIFFNVGLAR